MISDTFLRYSVPLLLEIVHRRLTNLGDLEECCKRLDIDDLPKECYEHIAPYFPGRKYPDYRAAAFGLLGSEDICEFSRDDLSAVYRCIVFDDEKFLRWCLPLLHELKVQTLLEGSLCLTEWLEKKVQDLELEPLLTYVLQLEEVRRNDGRVYGADFGKPGGCYWYLIASHDLLGSWKELERGTWNDHRLESFLEADTPLRRSNYDWMIAPPGVEGPKEKKYYLHLTAIEAERLQRSLWHACGSRAEAGTPVYLYNPIRDLGESLYNQLKNAGILLLDGVNPPDRRVVVDEELLGSIVFKVLECYEEAKDKPSEVNRFGTLDSSDRNRLLSKPWLLRLAKARSMGEGCRRRGIRPHVLVRPVPRPKHPKKYVPPTK